jgi:pimeloyl-ACP methyl ester carboxylesterase
VDARNGRRRAYGRLEAGGGDDSSVWRTIETGVRRFVATLVAGDPRMAGVVLVDANLPAYFDEAFVARLFATYTPESSELKRRAPDLARVMIPLMRAYPDTARDVRAVDYPTTLRTIDIVAERSWGKTTEDNNDMRRVHADFVAAAPEARELVLARGSGHYVMRDRPEVVLDAVARMLERVRTVHRSNRRA